MSLKNKSTYIFNTGSLSQCWQRSHWELLFHVSFLHHPSSITGTGILLKCHYSPYPLYKTWQVEKDVQIRPSTTTTTKSPTKLNRKAKQSPNDKNFIYKVVCRWRCYFFTNGCSIKLLSSFWWCENHKWFSRIGEERGAVGRFQLGRRTVLTCLHSCFSFTP